MKRYWKTAGTALAVILTVGTFYIQEALAESPYPDFVIKTLSGDEEQVAGLVLEGDLQQGESYFGGVQITADGSSYAAERSFVEQFSRNYFQEPKITEYQQEYRNFMRGKRPTISNFFENRMVLAYADVLSNYSRTENNNLSLQIEILEKDSGEVTEIAMDVPDREQYYDLYIEDVQISNNQMKVLTRNFPRSNEWSSDELHLYSLDLVNGKIVEDQVIGTNLEVEENQYLSISFLNNSGEASPAKHFVFNVEYQEEPQGEEWGSYPGVVRQELLSYNLATGEQTTVELPEEVSGNLYSAMINQEKLYIPQYTERNLEILSYNLEKQELGNTISIEDALGSEEQESTFTLKGETIYVVDSYHETNHSAKVRVFDIENGQSLYEGEVQPEESDIAESETSIFFYNTWTK